MIRSFLVVSLLILCCIPAAFGQGITATLSYLSTEGDPLTTECEGITPLPDGRIVRIFQDTNSNGPDPTDPQPTICEDPPDNCPDGTVNFVEFTINGVLLGLGEGYFYTTPSFSSFGGVPPGAQYYYLRIYEADGVTVLWTTETFFISAGGYTEIAIPEENWTCGQGGVQCLVVDETE
jgi:hypothetical protein